MLQPVSNLSDTDDAFTALFYEGDIPIEDRLKVYHNNVVGSISAALVATFPLLENLVGEDFLKAMARAFLFENPPRGGCIHLYGEGFDDFIKTYEPAQSLPYLADVASLELAMNKAYYALDDQALLVDALAKIPPEELGDICLNLRSSVTLLSSDYPLLEIRRFCLAEDQKNPPDLSQKQHCYFLISRPDLDVQMMVVAEDEFCIFESLKEGLSLGQSVERTIAKYPNFDFSAYLQKYMRLSVFQTLD